MPAAALKEIRQIKACFWARDQPFGDRHCEERSDEAIQTTRRWTGLLRFARIGERGSGQRRRFARYSS